MAMMEMRQFAHFSGEYDDDASKLPGSWASRIAKIRVINGRWYRDHPLPDSEEDDA